MESAPRTLYEYVTPVGKNPFRVWLDSLKDRKARCLVDVRLANVRRGTLGNCRSIGHGVLELKISCGPGYRIYFVNDGPVIIILLCGGTKRGQDRDISRAIQYWEEYKGREA